VAKKIKSPTTIESVGSKPKLIKEYFGMVNSKTNELSIAHMTSPSGWKEPGQTPDFDEYTVVLKGELMVETENETIYVSAGQGIVTNAGEWIRYSTPKNDTEYIAVCQPAFSPVTVNRDKE
tara:strand:- start:2694 stop:3056 length:363 start_codon:yes stop_codon:yes gene_type:complete